MRNSVFFLGIDSATWDLINPWLKKGLLPGFAKLKKQSYFLDLESSNPPLTPVAWTSLYTGVNAGKHNIFDFYYFDKKGQININLGNSNKKPTIFEIASKMGKKVAALNLPFTYPVSPVKGIMLSGFLTPGLGSNFIYPFSLKNEFKQKFAKYTFTEESRYGMDKKSQDKYFRELIASCKYKIKVFNWLESKTDWDLFAVNFMEVDHVQHWFFKEPKKMLRVYQQIDSYLLAKLRANKYRHFVVFSDHGAGEYYKNLNLNTYFLQKNILKLKPNIKVKIKKILFDLGLTPSNLAKLALKINKLPGSKKGRQTAKNIKFFLDLNDVDWQNSKAFSFGYYGNVYLIKKDKHTFNQVKQALLELKDNNKPIIKEIKPKKAVYSGPYLKNAPDILYSPDNYRYGSSAIAPFLDNKIFSTPHTLKTGEHRPIGITTISKTVALNKKDKVNIMELSSTLLDLLGIEAPNYFEEKSIIKQRSQNIFKDIDL